MNRIIAMVLTAAGVIVGSQAYAQDVASGPGAVVVTIIPAGGTFFTDGNDSRGPNFGNYSAGAGLEVNFNRFVGVEGELQGAFGITQDLQIGSLTSHVKTPNLLNYSANVVLSAPNR